MKELRSVRVVMAAMLTVLFALVLASAAPAQIVVGQTSPTIDPSNTCAYPDPYDEWQTSVSSGPGYAAPASGVLTSWSTNAGPAFVQEYTMTVLRPVAPATVLVVARDTRTLTPNAFNTFPIAIPVLAGDIVGISLPAGSQTTCYFVTNSPGDVIAYREGNALTGSTLTAENDYPESRLNISATLLPPPTVSSISSTSGSIAGGQAVTIAGANFSQVSGVAFGATPATSFAVDSEGQITAIAPPSKSLAAVPITVTTIAGVATSAQTFAYEGCRVPNLKQKKLKASKKKARKADCKIGKVKKRGDTTAKTGKVVKQNPKPGALRVPGTKIKVTIAG